MHRSLSPQIEVGSNIVPFGRSDKDELELSVVIPCLNEADTLAFCLSAAKAVVDEMDLKAEIIVADNGSTDGSPEIATRCGARVVVVEEKGYGNALMGGISAARGRYIIMGDADASYDFTEIPRFLTLLREGYSLVQGCRLPAGGGTIVPGAMPFLHRWLGNPFFSMLARLMYRTPINDINCGLRGFTKTLYQKLDQRCAGMEFAVEMVAKASLYRENIAEVPITLHRDRRVNRRPHLKTFRDGWRTLRFFLMCSPRWLFLYPGFFLIACGLLGYGLAMPTTVIGGVAFDVNTLLLSTFSILIGFQAVVFSVSAKTFAMTEGILPNDPRFSRLFRVFTLERGLVSGLVCVIVGSFLILSTVNEWWSTGFGALNYQHSLRITLPGVLFLTVGIQTILASFFLSILGMRRS